eukprot:NODE_1035_length_2508_cov_1.125363.p1 type:complete len:320 gc:universal NODE_1035_length_2508_cov_1.125363:535-1494(+)
MGQTESTCINNDKPDYFLISSNSTTYDRVNYIDPTSNCTYKMYFDYDSDKKIQEPHLAFFYSKREYPLGNYTRQQLKDGVSIELPESEVTDFVFDFKTTLKSFESFEVAIKRMDVCRTKDGSTICYGAHYCPPLTNQTVINTKCQKYPITEYIIEPLDTKVKRQVTPYYYEGYYTKIFFSDFGLPDLMVNQKFTIYTSLNAPQPFDEVQIKRGGPNNNGYDTHTKWWMETYGVDIEGNSQYNMTYFYIGTHQNISAVVNSVKLCNSTHCFTKHGCGNPTTTNSLKMTSTQSKTWSKSWMDQENDDNEDGNDTVNHAYLG